MPHNQAGRLTDPVLLCDLDGTLLAVNSFPLWARNVLLLSLANLVRAPLFWRPCAVAADLAARKLGLLSHDTLKWRLQRHWQRASRNDGGRSARAFADALRKHVRPELQPVLRAIANNRIDAMIATAAANDYAQPLGQMMGFRHVLATPSGELRPPPGAMGERKRAAVMRLLAELGWQDRPRIFLTDHADDLPLIRECHRVYWFGRGVDLARIRLIVPAIPIRPSQQLDEDEDLAPAMGQAMEPAR